MSLLKNGIAFRSSLKEHRFTAKQLLLIIVLSNFILFLLMPSSQNEPEQIQLPHDYVVIKVRAKLNTVFMKGARVSVIAEKISWYTDAILINQSQQEQDIFQSDANHTEYVVLEMAVPSIHALKITKHQISIYPKLNQGFKSEKNNINRDASF